MPSQTSTRPQSVDNSSSVPSVASDDFDFHVVDGVRESVTYEAEAPVTALTNALNTENRFPGLFVILLVLGSAMAPCETYNEYKVVRCVMSDKLWHEYKSDIRRVFDTNFSLDINKPTAELGFTNKTVYSTLIVALRLAMVAFFHSNKATEQGLEGLEMVKQATAEHEGFEFDDFVEFCREYLPEDPPANDEKYGIHLTDMLLTYDIELSDELDANFREELDFHPIYFVQLLDVLKTHLQKAQTGFHVQSAEEREAIMNAPIDSPSRTKARTAYNPQKDLSGLEAVRAELAAAQHDNSGNNDDDGTPPPRATILLSAKDVDATPRLVPAKIANSELPHTLGTDLKMSVMERHPFYAQLNVHCNTAGTSRVVPPFVQRGPLQRLPDDEPKRLRSLFHHLAACNPGFFVCYVKDHPSCTVIPATLTNMHIDPSPMFGGAVKTFKTNVTGDVKHYIIFPNTPAAVGSLMYLLRLAICNEPHLHQNAAEDSAAHIASLHQFSPQHVQYFSENIALDGSSHILKTLNPNGLTIFNSVDFRASFHLTTLGSAPQLAAPPFSKIHPTMSRAKALNNNKKQ